MITKMTKYSFIVYHQELNSFLETLQSLGMVDIVRNNKPIDQKSGEMFDQIKRYKAALKRLAHFTPSIESVPSRSISEAELLTTVESSLTLFDANKQELDSLNRDLESALPWGEIHSQDLSKIETLSLTVHFYVCSVKRFEDEWTQKYAIHELNRDNDRVYFALIANKDEETDFPLQEVRIPQFSISEYRQKIADLESYKTTLESLLQYLASKTDILQSQLNETIALSDLYLAGKSSVKEADDTLALLTGYAPKEQDQQICNQLESTSVYFTTEEAKEEDNPPVKLKNNWFTKLFEPIGELYMLPKYGELDLTPYFAPFYMLFFGLCLGDMGYGLVMLIGAGLAKLKFKEFKPYLNLLQFLGFGAVLMASLTGVFFGAKLNELFTLPDAVNGFFFSDLKMFWFAIIFGLVQILFARMLNAIDSMIRKGWIYGMANIGWTLLIIWCSFAYAETMMPELGMPAWLSYLTGWGGLALIVLFSSTEGNVIGRIFKGAFSLYDITGVFGDMLSYIRLFGLGTAGGILGLVVNSVAINMSSIPYVGWLFTLIMLLIGHTAVLLLSMLGAFVHPMRLTFVEFYKNSGFTGGGKAFNPLKK